MAEDLLRPSGMAAAPATPMETYKFGETDDTDCVL